MAWRFGYRVNDRWRVYFSLNDLRRLVIRTLFGMIIIILALAGCLSQGSRKTHAPSATESPQATNTYRASVTGTHDDSMLQPADALYAVVEDSPLYERRNLSSNVIDQVHRGRTIHVIGVSDRFLQVKLRRGPVGFVPKEAAEYQHDWRR
jgi:hypothetical protein